MTSAEAARIERLARLMEELETSESRYLDDLCLVRGLFFKKLAAAAGREAARGVFLNWDELIELAARLNGRLRAEKQPGIVFSSEIDRLAAFVHFCSQQTAALERLNELLQQPETRRVYSHCCQHERARGLSLSYFLLLPLTRVTRYPLLFEKMLECAPDGSEMQQSLDVALQLLRCLVAEVNHEISEADNIQLLYWTQQHVTTGSFRIEFTSATRQLGARAFLHSGVLYKERSGRLLVGLLFNDFLLLTSPNGELPEGDAFKVSKTVDASLAIYKEPLLLSRLRIAPISKEKEKHDDVTLALLYGPLTINLRAANRNARQMWQRQLDEALDAHAITTAAVANRKPSVSTDARQLGRLLVEVVALKHVAQRLMAIPLVCRVALERESMSFDIASGSDLTALRLTTQFVLSSPEGAFTIALFARNDFSPDSPLFEEGHVGVASLINEAESHRGPLIKAVLLRHEEPPRASFRNARETVMVKFVVQLFEDI